MATRTATAVVRADVVGSLLRPEYLRDARAAALAGTIDAGELRAAEDRAVLEAIALQESAGIQAITDGEYRRHGWIALIPIIDDPLFQAPVSGFEFLEADSGWRGLWKTGEGEPADTSGLPPEEPFVTRRLEVDRDIVTDEFAFLKANAHARAKYTIPAPSWHRIYWHPEHSTDAYPTSDDFIADVARILREHVVDRLVALGCDYIQIDAPNYAQWHIDPANRAAFEAHGHDMAHELVADAEFDSMVFEGLTGVTRAMHMCRGNAPGGMWAATGGYEAISKEVFPRLRNLDRLLLEYDSDRAGTFAPLADVLPSHEVVLGLVTTKDGALEDPDDLVARVEEASRYVPLERLAVSPQCGFASGVIGAMTRGAAGGEAQADRRRRPAGLGLGELLGLGAGLAQRPRPDSLLAGREDAVGVDGVLDRLGEPEVGVVAERVLLGGDVHEVEVGAVLAVPVLRGLLDEEPARVVRAARLGLVLRVEDDHRHVDEAARVRRDEDGGVVEPRPLLDEPADQIAQRDGVRPGEPGDGREADVPALLAAVPPGHRVDAEVRHSRLDALVRVLEPGERIRARACRPRPPRRGCARTPP